MTQGTFDLASLLRTLEPVLQEGVYVYCAVPHGADVSMVDPVATFRETEALTLILSEEQALKAGFSILFRAGWITLKVHSDLQAIGLTAAFSRALGEAGISCNVVAAAFHDHVFVPIEHAPQAVDVLKDLQRGSGSA